MVTLTNNAEYVLSVLYKAYLTKRENGAEEWQAQLFGSAEEILWEYTPAASVMDLLSYTTELEKAGFMTRLLCSNSFSECQLLPAGIAYMEHKYERNIKEVAKGIAALAKIIKR